MKRNTRIKDIAQKAGVSIGTVDRVLHKRGEVSKATKEKILNIIEEFDYHPNILASSLATKKSMIFATLLPNGNDIDSYWSKPQIGIEKAIMSLSHYGVRINQFFFDLEDSSTFTKQAELLLNTSPDGVLIAPLVKREAFNFTQVLDTRKIPYFFIDSTLSGSHPIGFVAQNPFQSGFLAAKLIDYALPQGSKVLLIHLAKELDNANHLIQRELGFYSFMNEKSRKKHFIHKLELSGTGENLISHLRSMGVEPCKVDALFVTNSKVHLVARLFKEECTSPTIIGYDLLPSNIELLKQGMIDFLISQKPEAQGFLSISMLFDALIKKEKIKSENFTPIDIITEENIDFYNSF